MTPLRALTTRLALLLLSGVDVTAAIAAREFDFTRIETLAPYSLERGYGIEGVSNAGSDGPFHFSVSVPEGNYRVTVTLGAANESAATLVRAETRRLMLAPIDTAPGEFVTRSFIVNVRQATLPPLPDNAPGARAVTLNARERASFTWDEKLTLEFAGAAPRVRSVRVEPAEVPTVFLLGDSTVTDQPIDPAASWGQLLPRFFRDDVAIANHAESGETLKSFLTSARLAKVLSLTRRGDWMLIQFGHNDQKAAWPQTYAEAHTTYRAYLKAFVAEAKLRGVHAVLVTSPERRTFTPEGKIHSTHGDYPHVVREVATEQNIPWLDLRAASVTFYEALGAQRAPAAFADDGRDATHHNNYGAYVLAGCVAEELRRHAPALAAHLAPDAPTIDPQHPPHVEALPFLTTATRQSGNRRGN